MQELISMTDEQFKMLQLTYLICGAVVGIFAGAPIWCALASRIIAKWGWSREDDEE